MSAAIKFRQSNLPRQPSELMRLKVIKGPDYGTIYVVIGSKVTIGRGTKNDIVISDLKSSRTHAEFFIKNGIWFVRDAGSINGIQHNGNEVRAAELRTGNTVTIGETTLEFMTRDANTVLLKAPPKSVSRIKEEYSALDQQRKRVQNLASFGDGLQGVKANFGGGSSAVGGATGDSKGAIKVAFGIAVLLILLFVDVEGERIDKVKKRKESKTLPVRHLATYLPDTALKEINKEADKFFKLGFREYREGNYLRARSQFEFAIGISPTHKLSNIYLENCVNAIKLEVEHHIIQGKRSLDAGRLSKSKGHFEAVLRLLDRERTHESYIEAQDQLSIVKVKKRGDA